MRQRFAKKTVGVALPPTKSRLFDQIEAAGKQGIKTKDLRRALEVRRAPRAGLAAVKSHLWQINSQYLAGTDFVLVLEGRGDDARWFLRRRDDQRAA